MTATNTSSARLPALTALTAGTALLLGAMTAAPAWAHDTLIGSTPEADSVLDESPEEIVLEFSGDGLTTGESVPNTIWVTDEDGEHWEGETEVDGPTMRTELEDPLPNGEYEVLYHAVYSDGHSEELDFTFEVDAAEVADETDTATQQAQQDDGGPAEETHTAEPGTTDTEGAGEPSPEAPSSEETNAEEVDAETATEEESQFPVGAVVGIGAGVLVLIVVALLLVRRKVTQGDQD